MYWSERVETRAMWGSRESAVAMAFLIRKLRTASIWVTCPKTGTESSSWLVVVLEFAEPAEVVEEGWLGAAAGDGAEGGRGEPVSPLARLLLSSLLPSGGMGEELTGRLLPTAGAAAPPSVAAPPVAVPESVGIVAAAAAAAAAATRSRRWISQAMRRSERATPSWRTSVVIMEGMESFWTHVTRGGTKEER
eukprot:evm.model.NODE_35146_length_38824_cov_40.990341.5